MRTEQPKMIYLKDYQAPDYLIDETHLTFELFEDHSLVHAQLVMRRNPERGAGLPPLVLDGQQLELLSVNLADQELTAADYQLTDSHLTLHPTRDSFTTRHHGANPPGNQYRAGRPVQIRQHVLHPVRGRRLPQDHLLPRPPGCDEHVHHHA